MPPRTRPPARPTGRGEDAVTYLEHHGYRTRRPAIRSSDYDILTDPFRYYLRRRLGLTDRLHYSEALSRGSWFHTAFELCLEPPDVAEASYEDRISDRMAELEVITDHHGISEEGLIRIKAQEEHDARTAWAWFQALSSVPLPSSSFNGTFVDWMRAPMNRVLGFEITAYARNPISDSAPPIAAQFDALIYQPDTNKVWIVDPKTCSGPPSVRLSTCLLEFQTHLYLKVLDSLLANFVLTREYDIPADAEVGGFIHVAVQKPNIKFGQADRPYEETPHVIQRGPRKGQTEIRRSYYGEPTLNLYVERLRDWYHCTGPFSHRHHDEPIINRSIVNASVLRDETIQHEFMQRLQYVTHHATLTPLPRHFRMGNIQALRSHGKEHYLLPFYTQPVGDWPSLIQELGLIQQWRDPEHVTSGIRKPT